MATLWLTCRRPFHRADLNTNAVMREKIKEHIVDWTGWDGRPHDVQWKLRIHEQPVTREDAVVYFVWTYRDGLISSSISRQLRGPGMPDAARQRLADDHATMLANNNTPHSHWGLTEVAGRASDPTISEVWMLPHLHTVFQLRLSGRWSAGGIDRVARLFAATALHEVGHNKVEPAMQASNRRWDLHNARDGGGGIFGTSGRTQLNDTNLDLLNEHFTTERQQLIAPHPAFADTGSPGQAHSEAQGQVAGDIFDELQAARRGPDLGGENRSGQLERWQQYSYAGRSRSFRRDWPIGRTTRA